MGKGGGVSNKSYQKQVPKVIKKRVAFGRREILLWASGGGEKGPGEH